MSTITKFAGAPCAPCPSLTVPVTDPLAVLRRLPRALFDQRTPTPGNPGAVFGQIYFDETIFGPIDPTEPTPQYELAKFYAAERDQFVLGWRRAVSLQLGLGIMRLENGQIVTDCPHAEGTDLDLVAEQYGVPRPMGFTDCCYWQLVLLLLFKPGTTRWLLSEICELYTGLRPGLIEEPMKLILSWPISGGVTFTDDRTTDPDPGGWFVDNDAYADGDVVVPGLDTIAHGYAQDGPEEAGDKSTFADDAGSPPPTGITLDQALARVKAAGVAISHLNRPVDGLSGCYGATQHGQIDGFVAA